MAITLARPGIRRRAPQTESVSTGVNGEFRSGNLTLARYLARPAGRQGPLPGVILCHGFPIGPLDARQSAGTFPELIDRMANELGWAAMTFNFRGCGNSEGDFSLQGWVDDLRAAIDNLIRRGDSDGDLVGRHEHRRIGRHLRRRRRSACARCRAC